MAGLVQEALRGALNAVAEEEMLLERLQRAVQLAGAAAAEIAAGTLLTPGILRALHVHRTLPVAGHPRAAAGGRIGVLLAPDCRYGPWQRSTMDWYMPHAVYMQLQHSKKQHQQQQEQQPGLKPSDSGVPVVLLCHGGVWASGEPWHFAPMAARLAQAGMVVAVIGYTLYPDAQAADMAAEVLQAVKYVLSHAKQYGGDPAQVTMVGHSAGAHLVSLALLMLAQQRQDQVQHQQQQPHSQKQQPPHQQQHEQQQQQQQQQQRCSSGQQHCVHDTEQPRAGEVGPTHCHHGTSSSTSSSIHGSVSIHQSSLVSMDLLALPLPRCFVGMCGVYNIPAHYEYERSRGVNRLSSMGRACGGPACWRGMSPSLILADAAAGEAVASDCTSCRVCTHSDSIEGSSLIGDAVPARFGMHGMLTTAMAPQCTCSQTRTPSSVASASGMCSSRKSIYCCSSSPAASSRRDGTAAAASAAAAIYALTRFTLEAAAHLPPFVLMSSCADRIVLWQESAEMAACLHACGVPVRQLVYTHPGHNSFIFDWSPLSIQAPQSAELHQSMDLQLAETSADEQQRDNSSAAPEMASKLVPMIQPFASDPIAIASGSINIKGHGMELPMGAPCASDIGWHAVRRPVPRL